MAQKKSKEEPKISVIKKQELKKEDPRGILVAAGLFIGVGIGFLKDQILSGLFIGLGVGLGLVALVRLLNHLRKKR